MNLKNRHITKSITSSIEIPTHPKLIWENITNVKIEQFSDPKSFKLLGIPKPLKADMLSEGKGGKRVAYFDSGKQFIQEITVWKPLEEYSFNFNPEKGFVVAYFFDIRDGIFRILSGSYLLIHNSDKITLQLSTTYSIDKNFFLFFNLPVRLILNAFQHYLLKSIKKNSQ